MLKPQLAGRDRDDDGMCREELQMAEPDGKQRSSGEDGEPMKRKVSYETLERMSLEALLYHVLVGDGRVEGTRADLAVPLRS